MRKYVGFTLVELLVVLGLIGLLFAMILPSLRMGRQKARETLCAVNVKNILTSALAYSSENDSLPYGFCDLPGYSQTPPGGAVGSPSLDWMGWWWFHFLWDYTGNNLSYDGPFWCPSRPKSSDENLLCGNYGANYSLCRVAALEPEDEFHGTPARLEQIKTPSSTVLFIDSGYSLISWKVLSEQANFEIEQRKSVFYLPGYSTNLERTIDPGQLNDAHNGRHTSKSVIVGFTDGCVGVYKVSQFSLNASESDRFYFRWSCSKGY